MRYLSVDEAAKEYRVHKNTIFRWLKMGLINANKIGRSWFIEPPYNVQSKETLETLIHNALVDYANDILDNDCIVVKGDVEDIYYKPANLELTTEKYQQLIIKLVSLGEVSR